MNTPLTREQQIIKSFVEGNRVEPARTVSKTGRTPDNPSAESPEPGRRLGLGLSSETMEQLAKRAAQDSDVAKAREERGGGEVDRNALRREILGSDRLVKARAQSKFISKTPAKTKYVTVAERIRLGIL